MSAINGGEMQSFEDAPVVTGDNLGESMRAAVANGQVARQVKTNYCTAVAVQKKRSSSKMIAEVLEEAEQAGSTFYYRWEVENRRKGTRDVIIGGSIDLAASIFRAYGNCAMDLDCNETNTHYFFTAIMIDLESGMSWPRMFRQRKSQAIGKFDQDRQEDIVFQIGQSKAMRNAILSVMPRWLVDRAIDVAREAEIKRLSGHQNLALARAEMLKYFSKLGVTPERVEARLGKKIGDTTAEDLADLRSLAGAIKDRMTAVNEAFPVEEATTASEPPPAVSPTPPPPKPAEAPPAPTSTTQAPPAPEPPPTPPPAPPQPEAPPAPPQEPVPGNPFDDRSAWKNFKSKTEGLSTFYFKNRKAWPQATAESQLAFAAKWMTCYPQNPFPGEIRGSMVNGTAGQQQPLASPEGDPDPRNGELLSIREEFGTDIIKAALHKMGLAENMFPPTLEGVKYLRRICEEIEPV
jgi:outer membrane biosynthesis protein TonB